MSPNDRSSESGLRDYCKAEFFNTIDRLAALRNVAMKVSYCSWLPKSGQGRNPPGSYESRSRLPPTCLRLRLHSDTKTGGSNIDRFGRTRSNAVWQAAMKQLTESRSSWVQPEAMGIPHPLSVI